MEYRKDIQVLRGLAVLAVVLFHTNEGNFSLGYLGVDVFFVISGFVVTPLILRIFTDKIDGEGISNLRYFYKRRFFRLAPALAATFVISAILIFLFGPVGDHQRFARQGIATLLLLGNVGAYRYSGDYFSPNPNPLVHTWSLAVEEQICIILPLVLMLIVKNRRSIKKTSVFLLGILSVVSFLSFLYPVILEPLYSRAGIELASQFSFYSPIGRIWQFSVGGLAFLSLDRFHKLISRIPRGLNLLIAITIILVLFGPFHANLKASSILASLSALFVIIFKSLNALPNFLIHKLAWVGDRSYSIYLVHMPLLYIARYSPITLIGTSENRLIQSVIAMVASISLGALSFSKIENRFRDLGKSYVSEFKTISTAVALTLSLPLFLCTLLIIGEKEGYWGLDRTIELPPYAGFLDPKCARDSLIGPPCVYETSGATKTVLLIGDSHAGHISQAVFDAAQSENWNAVIWTHSSCLIQFKQSISERVSDNCISVNKKMKKWVKENNPEAIIISQFVRANSSQSDLRDALLTLRTLVPNILMIENNPIFPDEKDFMVRRPLAMPAYEPPKSFSKSRMQIEDKNASNVLANWARRNEISTTSLDSHFCKMGVCSRYSDNGWLYRDTDHLSVVGAALTIPQLRAFLKQL